MQFTDRVLYQAYADACSAAIERTITEQGENVINEAHYPFRSALFFNLASIMAPLSQGIGNTFSD